MADKFEFGFEPIAAWLQAISAETSYAGVAATLLKAGMSLPHVERGATILSEQGELFEAANAGFPRDLAEVILTEPLRAAFTIPDQVMERAISARKAVAIDQADFRSAFSDFAHISVSALCMPLCHKDRVVGILYLEAPAASDAFSPACIAVATMLAAQAAVSFESARLFEALRETHKWMVKGQQVGRMGSYRFNTRTRHSRGSKEIYEILGLDTSLRPVPFDAFRARIHPDDLPNLEAAIAGSIEARTPFRHEYRVVHPDGVVLEVIAVGEWDETESGDLELEGIISDITETKSAQRALANADAQLERAAGLANLGEIAGSIIHEINQPLTAIIAGAEASIHWMNREIPDLAEARASMQRTIEAGRRAAAVVQSLRSLVKRSQLSVSEFGMDDAIGEAILLARPELERSGVLVRTKLFGDDTVITGDKIQLQQVILNLVRNGAEAMCDVRGRSRVLTAESSVQDETVTIAIRDTGEGLAPDARERLFEALYTTKPQGLGLGLAICRKIVSAHGGKIWVEGNAPCGTSVCFTLPLRRGTGF